MTGTAGAVFFLSDYGLRDEFVGVVHAVLHRLAPHTTVVDLGHGGAPFDVAGGAARLARAAPHLGPGVVLAVVDPGVGTDRRPVAVGVDAGPDRPAWLVGPDNGLLPAAADRLGGAVRAVVLHPPDAAGGPAPDAAGGPGPTFDGRDLFAPAAAHLVLGGDPDALGEPADPTSLVPGGPGPAAPVGTGPVLVSPVGWVDRFGNVGLAVAAPALDVLGPLGAGLELSVHVGGGGRPSGPAWVADRPPGAGPWQALRRVRTFADLAPGELGVLVDASGLPAVVLDRAPAAARLGVTGPPDRLVLRRAG